MWRPFYRAPVKHILSFCMQNFLRQDLKYVFQWNTHFLSAFLAYLIVLDALSLRIVEKFIGLQIMHRVRIRRCNSADFLKYSSQNFQHCVLGRMKDDESLEISISYIEVYSYFII
jgi:hypothetical protein